MEIRHHYAIQVPSLQKSCHKVDLDKNRLAHHGTKGQKWGVRRGPPYPLDESKDSFVDKTNNGLESDDKSDTITGDPLKEAIDSGKVKTSINPEKQGRHSQDSGNCIEGRSYMYGTVEDAQKVVDEYSGNGVLVYDSNGNWTHKERITANRKIGDNVDPQTNEAVPTKNAMIIYSKTGTHVMPRKEDK